MTTSTSRQVVRMTSIGVVVLVSAMLGGCGSDSADGPDAAPSTPAPSTSATSGSPCWGEGPDNTPPSSSPETEDYIGLTVAQAKDKASAQDQQIRVAGRDGECYALTMDYRPDRVNLYLESAIVVAATLG